MAASLPGFPKLPKHTQIVTLGAAQYAVTFTYRQRTLSWYVDIATQDGIPIVSGRRMSPGWSPLLGLVLESGPDGVFVVRGPEDYVQADLGTNLLLIRYDDAEVQSAATSTTDTDVIELG